MFEAKMSLLQRVDRAHISQEATVMLKERVLSQSEDDDVVGLSSIRRLNIDSRIRKEASTPSVQKIIKEAVSGSVNKRKPKDFSSHSVAIGLIDEVANILPVLIQRNEDLENEIIEIKERHEAELESATLIACEWRKSAESSALKVGNLERKLQDAMQRLTEAEINMASQEEIALQSGREAAEAECLSSLFEDKVLQSFGVGSLFQTAMERLRNTAESETEQC